MECFEYGASAGSVPPHNPASELWSRFLTSWLGLYSDIRRQLWDILISCLCFPDITAKEFIELRGRQQSRYDLLLDFLSEMLSVPPDDVNIFSLIDVKDRMLDVRFAVHVGPSFLQPEKMHGYLAAHKQKVGWVLQECPPPLVKTFTESFTIVIWAGSNLLHLSHHLEVTNSFVFFFLEQLAHYGMSPVRKMASFGDYFSSSFL